MRIPTRSLSIALVGLALVSYLLFRLLGNRASPAEAPSQAAQSSGARGTTLVESSLAGQKEMAEIKRELARHQYELVLLRQEMSMIAGTTNVEGGRSGDLATGGGSSVAPAADSAQLANAVRAFQKSMQARESSFRNEPKDPKWSETTASIVQSLLNKDEELRAATRKVECRSKTCRIELIDSNSRKLNASLNSMVGQLSQVLPNLMGSRIDEGNGKAALVYYLSRDAHAQEP